MTSRVGNTENLEGTSTYDLLVFDFPDGYPTGSITLGFGTTPKRISGVQKVAQVFTKALLTGSGTDVVYGSLGTSFPEFTGTYNLQVSDNSEIQVLVNEAISAAETQAKSTLNVSTAGLASQLESASLIGLTKIDDGITVQIYVLTKSGETAPIALPFTSLGLEINE